MEIKIKLAEEKNQQKLPLAFKKEPDCLPDKSKMSEGLLKIYQELDELIGLWEVKAHIYEIQAFCQISQLRRQLGLCSEPTVLHSVFFGRPGSGKTTVARILAGIYQQMGVLSKGHIIEVERADLVGEYVGHTAQKTKEQVSKALGGVLFIDEAYSLCRGGEKDFGREAIDVLVKAMEDHKTDFILILAGYNNEMADFLASNPGLSSRIPLHCEFADYSLSELLEIADLMFRKRVYRLNEQGREALTKNLRRQMLLAGDDFGNARCIRNLVEAACRAQAVRLSAEEQAPSIEQLQEINELDIKRAVIKPNNTKKQENSIARANYL